MPDDETQNPGDEAVGDDHHIEMPAEHVDPAVAAASQATSDASAAIDDAWHRWEGLYEASKAAHDAWVDAATAASDAREALDKADDDNVADARAAAEATQALTDANYEVWQAIESAKHIASQDYDDARDVYKLANAADDATRAIHEGYREAKAIADESDAAGAAYGIDDAAEDALGAAAEDTTEGAAENQTPMGWWEEQFGKHRLLDEKDEQEEKEAPPVDKPDTSSATEQVVEPPGSEGPPIPGDASRLMGGEGALPTEDLRDEAFSGEEEGGGAPEAAAAEVDEIGMPAEYVGQAGAEAAAQEPNNAPDPVAASPEELGQDAPAADPWGDAAKLGGSEGLGQEQPSGEGPTAAPTEQGGSPFFGVDETGPPAGDVFDHEQATAEGVEIEMPPDYVGQASVDAGGGEIEIPPDAAETETPPEDHFEEGF